MSAVRKFVVATIGATATAFSLGLIPDPASKWVAVAAVYLAAYGVWKIPNTHL